jgi:replication initiation protein RepC
LEADCHRYQLLLLCKRLGRTAGFSPKSLMLLDYYMAFTRDCDWEEGARPIVYQSLARTSLDLGISERQVQRLEQQLFALGAISWNDSGNHRRHGQRDPETGRILYAFGVDLTPLAFLRPKLEQKLAEKQLADEAWLACKREISKCRREICGMLAAWREEGVSPQQLLSFEAEYDGIAGQIRTHQSLQELRSLLDRHKAVLSAITAHIAPKPVAIDEASERPTAFEQTENTSPMSDKNVSYIHYTTQKQTKTCSRSLGAGFQGSVAEPSEPIDAASSAGLQHVTLRMALSAASERFLEYLPHGAQQIAWTDAIEAAYRLRNDLRISQEYWAEACEVLGRMGAALCVLIVDRAVLRDDDPVRRPAAYFRSLINRARVGELHLHNSVFALLDQTSAPAGASAGPTARISPSRPRPAPGQVGRTSHCARPNT